MIKFNDRDRKVTTVHEEEEEKEGERESKHQHPFIKLDMIVFTHQTARCYRMHPHMAPRACCHGERTEASRTWIRLSLLQPLWS